MKFLIILFEIIPTACRIFVNIVKGYGYKSPNESLDEFFPGGGLR